ncbi:SOUL family heme-binding protein [Parablastomonas sp. CN1-191]|uniref:SOUL family heme-binding protein n=1 Tax=Parablastomonas sp. CN1-191 TaxID=3400908 RepID=UPI003BF8809A
MSLAAALPLHRRTAASRIGGRLGAVVAGAGLIAAGGFAAYFINERRQEEAAHAVVETDGAFSLRRYRPLTVATVTRAGQLSEAMERAFGSLAAYIFAKPGGRADARSDARIAMTVPVSAAPLDDKWQVRFGLPADMPRSRLPAPGGDVEISEVPGRMVAAVRFAGRSSDRDLVAEKRQALLDWVESRGLLALGEPEFAGYNAPIVPGPLRRNEWWVEVDWAEGPLDN